MRKRERTVQIPKKKTNR